MQQTATSRFHCVFYEEALWLQSSQDINLFYILGHNPIVARHMRSQKGENRLLKNYLKFIKFKSW